MPGTSKRTEEIEEAVARGRMTRDRGDELLADAGVAAQPVVGVNLYPARMPDEGRSAPITVALVVRANGTDRAIMVRRDGRGWLVFSDDDGPIAAMDSSVNGFQQAVASARARLLCGNVMAGMTKQTTWLVAGQAVYRVVWSDDSEVVCKIEAGSDRVRGREVTFARTQIQAAIDLGEMRATRTRPRMIDQQLQQAQASKLDQEAALTTAKAAHWKGTKPDEPAKAGQADKPTAGRRASWDDDRDTGAQQRPRLAPPDVADRSGP